MSKSDSIQKLINVTMELSNTIRITNAMTKPSFIKLERNFSIIKVDREQVMEQSIQQSIQQSIRELQKAQEEKEKRRERRQVSKGEVKVPTMISPLNIENRPIEEQQKLIKDLNIEAVLTLIKERFEPTSTQQFNLTVANKITSVLGF
jgi:exoribonuclease R